MHLQKVSYSSNIFFPSVLAHQNIIVLVGLYEEPERPQNAVDYIKRYMGAPTGIDVEALKAECEQLRKDKIDLENQIKELNTRLSEHQA
jgi:cell division protein FtsB